MGNRPPEIQRGNVRSFLKHFAEGLRVLESQVEGNLGDSKVGCRQFFLRLLDEPVVDMLLCGLSGQHLQQIGQIVG